MPHKIITKHAGILSKALAVLIFAIIIIYYAITIINSNIMNEQMDTVSEHPYAVVVSVGDVKADLTLLRALPERLYFTQDKDVIDGVKDHYQEINKSMLELIANLQARYLADKVSVPAMEKNYQELVLMQNEFIQKVENKELTEGAIHIYFKNEMAPKLDTLDDLAETITKGAGVKLNEYSGLVTSSRNTMFIMATILSGTVMFAIIIYLYILHVKYKAEEEMFAIRAELDVEQRANAAKSRFLFNMSHDIRTPMNAIIGLTAIAAMDIDKKDKVKDCLTKISSSSKQLLGLINDVLDMSRIESGKISLNEEAFVLPELIEDFIDVTMPQAENKGLSFEINATDISHERVIGDPVQIKRMMVNIIGNALKFTSNGGRIWFTIRELPPTTKGYGSYQFIMRDTGVGMSENFLSKMFLPFERAETSTKSKVEGTGLGMAITKNIVDMMGGQIEVESKLGEGTTFTVTLPIRLQKEEELSCDYSKLLDLRSLVVDDDEIACENTVRIIQDIGMCSEGVLCGQEAVEKAKNAHEIHHDYHVVLVDWKMPGMDGVETTRQIRKVVGEQMPIIVLTAYDWADIEEEARDAGVNAFLSKPVFKSRLYHVMSDLTASEEEKEILPIEEEEQRYEGRVLLVEDNEINMEIAEEFITYYGVTIEKVWDGKQALDRIKTVGLDYYDLVFMDIQMPIMDGYEATKQIRKYEKECGDYHLPIVAMSANAFVEEVNKGFACGMDSYITKPVEMNKLEEELKKHLKIVN